MKSKISRDILVMPSICDSSSRLAVSSAFALFMDIATEHAECTEIGAKAFLSKGLFWLTVKTKIRFMRRPEMNELVTVSTWPEEPGKLRWVRDYDLRKGDEALAIAKSEWAIIDQESGKLITPRDIKPEGLDPGENEPLELDGFSRVSEDFGESDFGSYRVRGTDIDLGMHMNNAAYPRMLEGAFSVKEWNSLDIMDMEVHFRSSAYEGQLLRLQRRDEGKFIDLRAFNEEDGKTVCLSRITLR